jgi:hypothetical protein
MGFPEEAERHATGTPQRPYATDMPMACGLQISRMGRGTREPPDRLRGDNR